MLLVSAARSVNNYPTVLAQLPTEAPLQLQVLGLLGIGLVGLTISAVLVGLVLGAAPHRLSSTGVLPDSDALRLGIAIGIFGAAASAGAGVLRSPAWAQAPDVAAAGAVIPLLQSALDPITRVLMASAILLPTMVTVDRWTTGWTAAAAHGRSDAGGSRLRCRRRSRERAPGRLGAGRPGDRHRYHRRVCDRAALRSDDGADRPGNDDRASAPSIRAAERPYPGAVFGIAAGAALAWLLGWWWFKALRRASANVGAGTAAGCRLSAVGCRIPAPER